MELTKCMPGMIFVVKDRNQNSSNRSNTSVNTHQYLIIGECSKYGSIDMFQAMSITSMRNKDVTMEVPIVMINNRISYIVPYNIHSLHWSDVEICNFNGCLTNTDICTRDEFITFLRNIYLDSLGGLGPVSHDDIVEQYNDYCDKFFEKYSDREEYRDINKAEKEINLPPLPRSIIHNNTSIIINPPASSNRY